MSNAPSQVTVRVGDIFESEAQTWVNTVNTVGVMGKGVALGFKKRFPDMYADYVARCDRHEVALGRPYLYRRPEQPWIINFPTKDHWRSVSRLSDILTGLRYLAAHCEAWGIESLAVPPLGAGEGQLEWRIVGRTLYEQLSTLNIPVELYAPFGTRQLELEPEFLSSSDPAPNSRVPPPLVALVWILAQIEARPIHSPVGHTTFQKIAYFATESGIATGFEYTKGSYGPFSVQVKPALSKLVNNGLIVEDQFGRMLQLRPGPTAASAFAAFSQSLEEWRPVLERVVDLFLRMRTTKQAEIAATIHYAAAALVGNARGEPDEWRVLAAVMDWKVRRQPPLERSEVARAIRDLGALGWLRVQPSLALPVTDVDALSA